MGTCLVLIASSALLCWASRIPVRWALAGWVLTALVYWGARAVFAVLSLHP